MGGLSKRLWRETEEACAAEEARTGRPVATERQIERAVARHERDRDA